MIEFNRTSNSVKEFKGIQIPNFLSQKENFDAKTVASFGEEWEKFSTFDEAEINQIGDFYFDLLQDTDMKDWRALDAGCGSGRWSRYLSKRVKHIHAIDPSSAAYHAALHNRDLKNVTFSIASIDDLPFDQGVFDLAYSLGVLHHIPDTKKALLDLGKHVRKNGHLLLYLYYDLDGRSGLYRALFNASTLIRRFVSTRAGWFKRLLCDLLAILVYFPLVIFARVARLFSQEFAKRLPLAQYMDNSFMIMRNDALDRFGTPLEQRFTKQEITDMLMASGFGNIAFSDKPPFWHCIATKLD